MSGPSNGWLVVALTLSAACSMALEVVAGRLLAPYVGMSLYSWTAIIAVVLTGLSAGHWLGGVLLDRSSRPALVAGLSLLAAAATSFASLFVLRWSASWVLLDLDPVSGIGAMALLAFLLPSLFAGVVSPVLTQMALERAAPGHEGRVLGRMFALGAVGAILGTVAAGFWLLGWVGSHGAVLVVTLIYAALALPFLRGAGRVAAVVVLLVAAVGGVAGPGRVAALTSPCLAESDMFCIRVDVLREQGRDARVMVLDHLAHGVNDRADPALLLSPYLHLVDELQRLRQPGRSPEAFFVGGGAYTLPRAWGNTHPEARLTVAEIDPLVTQVAVERLWVDPSRFEVIHRDARTALRDLPEARRFDVIFGDAFHDIAIPQHLVTDEFHALVKARLHPDGFYAINVIEALREPPFLLSLVHTLRARFAHVELWLDSATLGPQEARATWVVIASDVDSGLREVRAETGFARTWLRVPTEAMLAVLDPDALVFLTDDYAPVDRLMRHILFDRRLAE